MNKYIAYTIIMLSLLLTSCTNRVDAVNYLIKLTGSRPSCSWKTITVYHINCFDSFGSDDCNINITTISGCVMSEKDSTTDDAILGLTSIRLRIP